MQKRNIDWFRLKHRTNNFNKPQGNNERVCLMKLQEGYNKIISLKHWIKVHQRSPVLKQDTVIEFLNEMHKDYVFVPIGKAASNTDIICKRH